MTVYEITDIKRKGENSADDYERIGKRYYPKTLEVGLTGILVYVDDTDMAVYTSPVQSVTAISEGITEVVTRNTAYLLREVKEANA